MVTPRIAPNGAEAAHGGADPAELARFGLRPEQVLDFSANVNPFGPSPGALRAIREAPLDRYPDRASGELRHELARRHGVADECVIVGNGSSELITLAAVAYLSPGEWVLILGPAFGEYDRAARSMGAEVVTCHAVATDGFRPPFDTFGSQLNERRPKVAFLTSPNNPTGQSVPPDRVFALAARHPQTLFVFDEAYADCLRAQPEPATARPPNVLRLRSLTKAHALAGLRLGYAIADREVVTALRAVQPAWSVNAPAQAAGLAAVRDEDLPRRVARWADAAAELTEHLRAAGFAPVPSDVPFFLLPVGRADRVRSLLLRRGILVRDCSSFGLPEYARISARAPEDNARLVAALIDVRTEVDSCRV